MAAEWDSKQLWCKHVERQLYELGALVRGQVPTVSARIADCLEQIDELRKELTAVHERMDKCADWIRTNIPKKSGEEHT